MLLQVSCFYLRLWIFFSDYFCNELIFKILHWSIFIFIPTEKGTFIDKIFKYFSTRCYKGFKENPENFYNVYREYFDDVAKKDAKYRKKGTDEPPSFGYADTDLSEVAGFYAYWSSYYTAMPFAWADKYNVKEANNSYEEKAMGLANKELRDKERKDFNERVRNLVLYIKKKDPRWEERVVSFGHNISTLYILLHD